MTGFGRKSLSSEYGELNVEIFSVNKRFKEISIHLPAFFSSFEYEIKKEVEKVFFRGKISVKLEFFPSEKKLKEFFPDLEFLKNLKKSWLTYSKKLGYEKAVISLDFLLGQSEIFQEEKIKDFKNFRKLIFDALNLAIKNVIEMKEKEGRELFLDIQKRINFIKNKLALIKKRIPSIKKNYQTKLKAKFKEVFLEENLEDRLFKELALFAEKMDVTEEIIRLDSHIKLFLSSLKAKQETKGKKLEFILQECLREVNTIASKAMDVKLTKIIVETKAEIEKIKEQLQNIE